MEHNYYIAILAGGVGSRFWPASREARPKQFLDMLGVGKSLLRLTYERFQSFVPADNIFCVTNRDYTRLVQTELPELGAGNIIGEPSRNNTAPSILYTALLIAGRNPDAVIGFVPSDHLILKEAHYLSLCKSAFAYAGSHDAIVTLGIEPDRPDTGYGYIHYESGPDQIKKVISFHEKPDLDTARHFVEAGDYLWNAGMFFMSVRTLLEAYEAFEPEMFALLADARDLPESRREAFLEEFYPRTRNTSVDYAILERSANVYTLPADIGWSDLGTWAALYGEKGKDAAGNVVIGNQILLENIKASFVRNNTNKLVILRDIAGLMVIVEEDVVLVYPLDKEQEIKQLRERLKDNHGGYL